MSEINLKLDGTEVSQLVFDFQITIFFSDSSSVGLECPFSISRVDGTDVLIDPEGPKSTLVPVLELHTLQVRNGVAIAGALILNFENGATLRCEPSEYYEAWSYSGPRKDPERIVSTPGGELGVWSWGR